MAATILSAPTHSAEALLNRARRLSSASYEKNHPQPPSPTRFAEGEELERLSPGIIGNSNGSHPFLSSRPLSGSRRRSSFGRTHLPPSFYIHANRSDTSADSERFLDPHRTRTPGGTTTSLALSLSSSPSSTASTPAPSSPSLSPTTTFVSSSSSSPTTATAEHTPTTTAAAIGARRSWSVNARPRALTLESIKETELLTVDSADNTLELLQAARKDLHRKHRSDIGQGLVLVSDILQVLRQGSEVDLTQTIGLSVNVDTKKEKDGAAAAAATAEQPLKSADNSISKEDDAGSSSSPVSLTVTLAPCIDADSEDAHTTLSTPSIHIIDTKGSGEDEGLTDAHGQQQQNRSAVQEASDTVTQTLSKAESEHKRVKAGPDSSKQLPVLPGDAKQQDINGGATISTTSDATIPSSTPNTLAHNTNNGLQGVSAALVPDSASLLTTSSAEGQQHDHEDDEEMDDVVAPLTTAPTSPSSISSQSLKSKDSTVLGAPPGKAAKLSKKRSSKLFGKLVPKFLQTSFTPSGPPMQGVALTPSPRTQSASSHPSPLSTSSTVTTPSSAKNQDKDASKSLLLPPLPSISPGIEKDIGFVLQQHTIEQSEPKEVEQQSLLDDGRKTSRRSSFSSILSRSSTTSAPVSAQAPVSTQAPLPTPPVSTSTCASTMAAVTTTTTTISNNSTIAVTFDEEEDVTIASTDDNDEDDGNAEKDQKLPEETQGQEDKGGDENDDNEFWSSILRKSCADTDAAAAAASENVSLAAATTTKTFASTRLTSHPSSTSLSSVHSLSSPVCYLTESPGPIHSERMESIEPQGDNDDDDNGESGCLGRDERRLRLRNAVAEWRRATSYSQ